MTKHLLDLSYLKLSTRAKMRLICEGLYTLRLLKKRNPSFEELLQLKNCGEKTAREIVSFLKTLEDC